MRRAAAVLALCCLCACPAAATNLYAPNVFDEVERGTPGYREIATLIMDGYAPGFDAALLEQSHLTRFELARALRAALANPAAATQPTAAAQREYARELHALGADTSRDGCCGGVRVGGDIRVRYRQGDGESETDARARVNLDYPIR